MKIICEFSIYSKAVYSFFKQQLADSPLAVCQFCLTTPPMIQITPRLQIEKAGCKKVRFHDLRHTFATTALANGMDVKTLSNMIGHVSAQTTLDIYSHSTEEMKRNAAKKIERTIGRNEGIKKEDEETPDQASKKPEMAKFEPTKGKYRKPGTGYITKINDNLYEGRYSPRLPNGKRVSRNIYAKTREECETLLAELIKEMKAEIQAEKERLKQEQSM